MSTASNAQCKDAAPEIELLDLAPNTNTLLADVLAGLGKASKTLPCKYFYDEQGARLFEQICELPEYYPTRTELKILQDNLPAIASQIGPRAAVIEPGSGSGIKTRLLLEALEAPAAYVPIDVAREQLIDYASELATEYPGMDLLPVCADFSQPLELPEAVRSSNNPLIYFPGSTIGNFAPKEAVRLLAGWRSLLDDKGALLIGVDLKKDPATLEAAYNDSQGVTAAFNLNLLARLNTELQANFNLDSFRHHADYDPDSGAVRMWLVSEQTQTVHIDGMASFGFDQGEAICTEHSHKYEISEFEQLAASAGWQRQHSWTDDQGLFSLHLLRTTG